MTVQKTKRESCALIRASLLLLLAAVAGCGSWKSPPRNVYFYTLEYPPPVFEKRPRLPVTLRVEFFQTSPDYTGRQIIYREADFSRQAYVYHKWRSPPGAMLSYLFLRDLGRCGLFTAVAGPGQPLQSGYSVSGMIDQFLEEDTDTGRFAVLTVTLTLARGGGRSPTPVFQRHYSVRQPVAGPTAVDVVRAMSRAADRFSRQAIADIYAALSDSGRKKGA